jgi:hypothetical protein
MTASDDDIRAKTLEVATAYGALLGKGDWDAWTDLWAEDGELTFPYAPAGRQKTYRGKDEIRAYMIAAAGKSVIESRPHFRIFPALDPTVVIVELEAIGRSIATGKTFHQNYVMFFEVKDGKLWRLRERWNVLVNIDAFGDGDRATWASRFGKPDPEAAA